MAAEEREGLLRGCSDSDEEGLSEDREVFARRGAAEVADGRRGASSARPSCQVAAAAAAALALGCLGSVAALALLRPADDASFEALAASSEVAAGRPKLFGEYSAADHDVAADNDSAAEDERRCSELGGHEYKLNWQASGKTFWDDWNYLEIDKNFGASEYLSREEANVKQVTTAFDSHAILRAGPRGHKLKRTSAKLETKKSWEYFLMAFKYEAVPWGCGLWPALWLHSHEAAWPKSGELDILEYANELTSRTGLHVDAVENRCKLNPDAVNRPGCPRLVDAVYNFTGDYDCVTNYPKQLGCAPNNVQLMKNGEELSKSPGVVAAEWTAEYVKVFFIPADEIPADLTADMPRPDGWDKWLMSYYPFAASEQSDAGSCPKPAHVLQAQHIILNIAFCGDWAAKVWANSTCANRGQNASGPWDAKGPSMPGECVAVDPHNPMGETPAGPKDCCTRFIYDEDGTYGTDEYLQDHGFFNISWLKVFQSTGKRGSNRSRDVHT